MLNDYEFELWIILSKIAYSKSEIVYKDLIKLQKRCKSLSVFVNVVTKTRTRTDT